MSVATAGPTSSDRFALPPEPVLQFTVDQYHEMARTGILVDGEPIELLEGWLVNKMTKYPPHSVATCETRRVLERLVPAGWLVDTQEPITTDDSEPEPDVSVVRGCRRDYVDHHPSPRDVGLLVEVADTSLDRDRGWKKRIYAAAGIPCYWIVNLIDRQVEVFTQPSGPGQRADYASRQVFRAGDSIPLLLDNVAIGPVAVSDLLP
jgi:Uma2 family endonuclease